MDLLVTVEKAHTGAQAKHVPTALPAAGADVC